MRFSGIVGVLTAAATANSLSISRERSQNSSGILGCLDDHNTKYAISSSANWPQLILPFNLRLSYTPAVVTLPDTVQEVSDAIICAGMTGYKVQAKGGGHSYASYSSGGQDGSLVIDMESFNSIEVDQSTWIVKVGSGVRLGNLALGIYDQGQRALPHGTCPGVGIGGHATHGGYGYGSRLWGLALDTIVALDVVLANGTEVHATETDFPEIFFAMRGAGDSFGVVTYFYLQTFPAPSHVLSFSANLGAALKDINVITTAFQNLQTFSLTSEYLTPNNAYGIYTDSTGACSLGGWCVGCDLDDFNANVFPAMLAGLEGATDISVQSVSWIDAQTAIAGEPLAQPLTGYNEHNTFYAKSVVSKNAEPLTNATIRSFWSYIIDSQGKGPFFSIINLYGGPGSKINEFPPDSSAYADRDALWVFQNYGFTANHLPPFDDSIIDLIDGLNNATTAVQKDGDFTGYLNYVDPDLTAYEAAELYYGPETYNKLLKIKAEVDPKSVFWNPQSIGNSPILPR